MILSAWGFGLAGLAYVALALLLLQRGYLQAPRERSRTMVLAAVTWSALWGWAGLAALLTGKPALALVGALSDVGRYGCWFAFMLALLQPEGDKKYPNGMNWLSPFALGLLGFALVAYASAALQMRAWGDPARLSLFAATALPVFALVLLEQLFRNAEDNSRWNIKPLCLGLAGAFVFDLYVYSQAVLFNHPDADALSIRGFVHALVVPLWVLSMTRRRNWLARIRLSPKIAFHTAALLIAGIYLVFISSVGYYVRYFGGEWGPALQQGLLFLGLIALVVLLISGSARATLRVALGKHFFRYRFDYREEWLRFTRTLSAQEAPQDVGQLVIRGLADMLESPAGGLWTRVRGEDAFSQTGQWNMAPALSKEAIDSPLCQFITHSGWVINLEEVREHPQRYGPLKLPAWLQDLEQAWLLVPLQIGNELMGFCVLASARTRIDVNWEVNDLLKTAGQQAASFLAQMQATEALLESRKFEAFNRMSAFVVHDLKNIVTQLSLMMKNAKRLGNNPDFQNDMLMTVEDALERMRQMMLQLREGAPPPGPAFGVNLILILQRIAALANGSDRRLDIQLSEIVLARGHEDRLERIIGHVVQNAMDATETGGRVWINLERYSSQARISVRDTGPGMSPHFIQNRLFKPFQTTKPTGMGIGAYESLQYVRELGGDIEVESTLGVGTTIRLLLPLFEQSQESGFQRREYA